MKSTKNVSGRGRRGKCGHIWVQTPKEGETRWEGTFINKNELGACVSSHMQCSGQQVKNQNKVVTWNLEERANLSSHETAEEETVSHLKKQILILLIIQKLKNVRVSVFLCAHKCLLISKSILGRCCLCMGLSHLENCPWFRSPQPHHNRRWLQLVWKG